jgi:hypothetical protein
VASSHLAAAASGYGDGAGAGDKVAAEEIRRRPGRTSGGGEGGIRRGEDMETGSLPVSMKGGPRLRRG